MKIQTKTTWQKQLAFTAIAIVVFMFAANSLIYAQAAYKVGDRFETMSAGDWVKVEIIEVRDDGYYVIRYLNTGVSGAWVQAKDLRAIKADAPANNQNNAGDQPQNQTNGNTPGTNGGGTAATQQAKSIFEKYGSREPRTCADQKAPAKGAITAALAQKYFICKAEGVSSNNLYLIENIKSVEVGGGVPYHPTLGAWEAINVRVPLYPIRGNFVQYVCRNLINEYVGPPNANCTAYTHTKATGYCYKTTFGDWSCYMSDRSSFNDENHRTGVAPPKP